MLSVWTESIDHNSGLKRRITNFLSQRGVSSWRRLDIDVKCDTVTLRGTVPSFYERQLCLACTQHVPGVLNIVDELKVELPVTPTQRTEDNS